MKQRSSQYPRRYSRRQVIGGALATTAGVALLGGGIGALAGCSKTAASPLNRFAPPPYPNFQNPQTVISQAQAISDRLQQYILDWFAGKASATLPTSLLPDGHNPDITGYRLVRPDEVTPETQWGVREAQAINFAASVAGNPDPHATYLVMPHLFAPFGCTVTLDGAFPYSRFFDIQMTTSFDPYCYRYNYIGAGEVPLVDADIEPLPGHTNPFRVGADRTATQRGYQVTYDLAVGNPADLNPAFQPPDYRAPGNRRVGGAIMYRGPWGEKQYSPPGDGRGLWDTGSIWIRYYAPDLNAGPHGGAPLPRVLYQLPDGRQFYIAADLSRWIARLNQTHPIPTSAPQEPNTRLSGPTVGWLKQWSILQDLLVGVSFDNPHYAYQLDRGVAGRGKDLAPPNNFEPSATCCTYITYLGRGMALGAHRVMAITGTLPTTPKTRQGQPVMTGGQARYWSITSYTATLNLKNEGLLATSVMDDEIVTDEQGRYILVYSRAEDRPANATAANGVTWVDWGPFARQSMTLRWMSVGPEWSFAKAPNEAHLGWESDWVRPDYNPNLIGKNGQSGFLGAYQPVIHYLTKAQFEALGSPVPPNGVPPWK